jgi:hypothetical protein
VSIPTKELHARAEVVGYTPAVLEAVRDLVHEVQIDPVLAYGTGQMMTATKDLFAVDREGRPSGLIGAIAHLVTVAAEATLPNSSDAAKGSDQ